MKNEIDVITMIENKYKAKSLINCLIIIIV